MEVKQDSLECTEQDSIVIKQESAFYDLTETTDKLDGIKNEQLYPVLRVTVKGEPEKKNTEIFLLNCLHDVSDLQTSEGIDSDLFVTSYDLNVIKQEVSETDFVVPKAEVLDDCLKSDLEYLGEPSNSNHSEYILEHSKQEDFKIFRIFQKNDSSSYFKGHFWERWQPCEFCGLFYNKFSYFSHYIIHSVKMKAAHLLNYKTNTPSILKKHFNSNKWKIRANHYKKNRFVIKKLTAFTGQRAFKSEICPKDFMQQGHLNDHLKFHTDEKQFKCKICSKQFTRKCYLSDHLKIHSGEKPFKCKTCSKQFTQKGSLNNHLKVHTGDKPFKCKICSKQFTRKCYLSEHLKIHTGEKPFQCEICSKQFTQKGSLNEHLKIHTGDKPFKCQICSKPFTKIRYLNYHFKLHTGEKPFKCEICLKQFLHKYNLNRHLKIHTGDKPFKCKICFKPFTRNAHLNRHFITHSQKNEHLSFTNSYW